jgi:hypothetical protein
MLQSATPAHPPKSAEKLAQERGTWFDMYPGRAATLPFAIVRIEAAIIAGLDFRRCAMKPRPAKPRSSMAHVEGSGTASTPEIEKAMLSTVPPQWRDLRTSSGVPLGVNPDDPVEFIALMDRQ